MIPNVMRQTLSVLVCSTLLLSGAPAEAIVQEQTSTNTQSTPTSQGSSSATSSAPTEALETADQLDALVAPIALYPDALVAQVFAAATLPDEVAYAEDWLQQNSSLTGSALTDAVNQQNWDPSVKALTQFPSVLKDLSTNLAWTSSLGQAYVNQQSDVMTAVQVMRAKAQAAGTLQSSSQITVVQQSPSTIVIKPANPNVVYVPQYNATVVYGAPYVVPAYTPPVAVATAGVSFAAGVAVGAVIGGGFAGGGFGWGWGAWGCNWGGGGGGVSFNNNTYINKTIINKTVYNRNVNNTNVNRTTNNYNNNHPWGPNNSNDDQYVAHAGGATGSENHAWYGNNGVYHPDGNYKPGTDTHYGPNGGYHPNGYFGPDGGWHENKPGTNPHDQPNGGANGDHGLIGGNGGVQHAFNNQPNDGRLNERRGLGDQWNGSFDRGDQHNNVFDRNAGGFDRNQGRVNQPRSYMSGNGDRDRFNANRGRASMHQVAMHQPRPQHFSAPHNSGGGRRR